MKPTLVNLDQPNLRNSSDMLRRLSIEVSSRKDVTHTIVVMELDDGTLDVRGYGEVADTAREVGILHMAALKLLL